MQILTLRALGDRNAGSTQGDTMARTTVRYRINGGPLQRRNCITDKGTDAEILTLLAATHGCSEKEVEVQKPKASPAQSKSSPPPAGKEAASGKDAAGSGQTAKK